MGLHQVWLYSFRHIVVSRFLCLWAVGSSVKSKTSGELRELRYQCEHNIHENGRNPKNSWLFFDTVLKDIDEAQFETQSEHFFLVFHHYSHNHVFGGGQWIWHNSEVAPLIHERGGLLTLRVVKAQQMFNCELNAKDTLTLYNNSHKPHDTFIVN